MSRLRGENAPPSNQADSKPQFTASLAPLEASITSQNAKSGSQEQANGEEQNEDSGEHPLAVVRRDSNEGLLIGVP